MTRRPPRAVAAAVAAALAACAPIAAEGPGAGPPAFRNVRKLVLVRRVDDPRAPRGRDPLDALKEALDARGYTASIVEVGRGEDAALRDLDGLEDRLAARMRSRARTAGRPEALGADAGAVVARLGVDAVVGYHRLRDELPPLPPPPTAWDAPYGVRSPPTPGRRPLGAFSLLAASGAVAWFPWGGPGETELEPAALVNAAEAIDALVAALSGSAADDGGG